MKKKIKVVTIIGTRPEIIRLSEVIKALEKDETPFAYFTLANAYELAGDFQNALNSIDKAISMTELNNAYIRYRAEMIMRNAK